MTDAGFFRGTSTEQDVRFSDKDKKLLKTMKFEECLEQKVDLHKVNFEALKPWVSEQVLKILGIEDEVVVELIFSFLEYERFPNAKKLQILVTGFLQSKPARIFIGQLWGLLLNAQENPSKLPDKFIEEKKNAIRQQKKLIEKELNIRDEPRRYSPDKDEHYRRPHQARYRGSPRSPHWRTTERREKGNTSDIGTQVQKSEASSTQADLEQPGPTSASTLSRVENMIKSVEQVMQQQHTKDVHKGDDPRREDHRERSRSRSRNRSYSPSRRHRSRSHERGDSRERRHRLRRLSPPRRHRPSLSPYSPDSHSHHQRGRGYGRDSPHHSRPLRSPENRHRQEAPTDQHKHTELHYQGPIEKHRLPHREVQDRSDRRDSHLLPTQDTVEIRHAHLPKKNQEVRRSKNRSPHVQKESRPGRDTRKGRDRKASNTSSSASSSSSSSGSASPAKGKTRPGREAGRAKKNSSSSSSDSSESSNLDSRNRSRQAPAKHRTPAKLSSKMRRELDPVSRRELDPVSRRELDPVSRKEPIRESSKRGGVPTKRKPQQQRSSHQHRVNSPSDRSEHTSDNFSELEHKRKSSMGLKKQKQVAPSKRKHQRERYNVSVRSKVRRPQKKRRESIDRRVVVSKRKHTTQRPPSSDISDESEDNSELEEASKNVLKRKQRQMSPSTVKKPRRRKSLTLDSSSVSSESEESSSSESESEEQKRPRDKRKEKGSGKERKRIASGDSSEIESLSREKGRSSLEKHLRGKMIQAMSKKRQRKSKN